MTYIAEPSGYDIRLYVILRIIAGILFTVVIVYLIRSGLFLSKHLYLVFTIGLIARLILIPTEPVLEDDFNRYLWDGAVTANGVNPYKYPPEWFIQQDTLRKTVPSILYTLADSSGYVIERVNHPHIRTIYPPVAQITFALAYWIKPWSTQYYKVILLFFDLIVFFLLLIILRKMLLPTVFISIYWLNPVLLHEIFNAGHMDILMYPFILAGILYLLSNQTIKSVSFFSIAAGVKIWPIIFIPFVLKKSLKNKRKLIAAAAVSAGILIIILIPILLSKLDDSLGFVTYTKNWSNNDAVFQILKLIIKEIIDFFDISYRCYHCITRWVVALLFLALLIYFLKGKEIDNKAIITKYFYLVAVMYLISPTQFPWYYTWILPILAIKPRLSFVAYTILLPLYQLKYNYEFLVWIQHIPVIILFIYELKLKSMRDFLEPDRNLRETNS